MKLALWLVAALSISACASSVTPRTQVTVYVTVQPGVRARASRLRIEVRGGSGGEFDRTPLESTLTALPGVGDRVAIALTPLGNDATRTYRVTATAIDSMSRTVAEARVISGYLSGRTLEYELALVDSCIDLPCLDVSTTCREAMGCRPAMVDPDDLIAWTMDAGMRDATVPIVDTGTDSFRGDAAPNLDAAPPEFEASGTYACTPAPTYSCARASFDGRTVTLVDSYGVDSGFGFQATIGGLNCQMLSFDSPHHTRAFDAECMAGDADCTEVYRITGAFTTDDEWTGMLTASFISNDSGTGTGCGSCATQSFSPMTCVR